MAVPTSAAVGEKITATKYNSLVTWTTSRTVYRRAATQSVASSSTLALLVLDTAVNLPAQFTFSGGTLTCVTAGTYEIVASASIAANTTGNRYASIRKNTTPVSTTIMAAISSAYDATVVAHTVVTLAAADTIDMAVAQSSGGSLGITGQISIVQIT